MHFVKTQIYDVLLTMINLCSFQTHASDIRLALSPIMKEEKHPLVHTGKPLLKRKPWHFTTERLRRGRQREGGREEVSC